MVKSKSYSERVITAQTYVKLINNNVGVETVRIVPPRLGFNDFGHFVVRFNGSVDGRRRKQFINTSKSK